MIRCPCCQQRFKVNDNLMERMVECGVCDWRFQVTEEVVVRGRKFYPGESRLRGRERFQRIPGATAAELTMPVEISGMYESPPPQRILAGILGAVFMIGVALLLVFGSEYGGPLDGMSQTRRFIIAGFASALGFVLLLYANKAHRLRTAVFVGLCAAGLASLPAFFTPETERITDPTIEVVKLPESDATDEPLDPEQKKLREISERIGLAPLEREIERLKTEESSLRAYGVYFVGLQESNRIAVRDYMYRVTSPDPYSHIYPRDEGTYLLVLSGLHMSIDRLALLTKPLGEVRAIVPEISVVELLVDSNLFVETDPEALVASGQPSFYELNLRELRSIEIRRVENAVNRLAAAEPTLYRADITRVLRELMNEPGVNFHASIARALGVWDEDADGLAAIANATAARLHARGTAPPVDVVALAVRKPEPELVPVLVSQWRTNTPAWENLCVAAGPIIEEAMLGEFAEGRESNRRSAARILGKIGGADSQRALEAALDDPNQETAWVVRQALDTLTARLAGSGGEEE